MQARKLDASFRTSPGRRGAALLLSLFVMAVVSTVVVAILDTQTMQYMSLNNTTNYDRSRYLAEAGIQHVVSALEQDFLWASTVTTSFPPGSGDTYTATATHNADGTVTITSAGTAGSVTRRLEIVVKMGG